MDVVISPHFDDAHFGVGGYLAKKLRDPNYKVLEYIVSASEYMRRDGLVVTVAQRIKQQHRAIEDLGGRKGAYRCVLGKGLTENRYDQVPLDVLAGKIERVLGTVSGKLDRVFIPAPSYNQDHRRVYDACQVVFRPTGNYRTVPVVMYEVPGQKPPQGQAVYSVLDKYSMTSKISAVARHSAQTGTYPQNKDGVRNWAEKCGLECNATWAERFWPQLLYLE
jgi:LmbE family N-acetylglucosaminyl deacetylase